MQKTKISVTCACCGHESQQSVMVSKYIKDTYLDGKPMNVGLLPIVMFCPECKYVAMDIHAPIDEKKKEFIKSDEYTRLLDDNDSNNYDIAYALLGEGDSHAEQDAAFLQWSAWKHEFDEEFDVANHKKEELVVKLKTAIEKAPRAELVLLCIEVLRQLSRFDECNEYLEAIEESMQANKDKQINFYKLFELEKKLIINRDSKPHFRSEVV